MLVEHGVAAEADEGTEPVDGACANPLGGERTVNEVATVPDEPPVPEEGGAPDAVRVEERTAVARDCCSGPDRPGRPGRTASRYRSRGPGFRTLLTSLLEEGASRSA